MTEFNYDNFNTRFKKRVDEKLNRSTTVTAFDKLKVVIEDLKKAHANNFEPDKDYIGQVILNRSIAFEDFLTPHKGNKPWIDRLHKLSDTNAKKEKTITVMEVYVNIPDISGFLPSVNTSKIISYFNALPNSRELQEARADRGTIRKEKETLEELRKAAMYPRFYRFYNDSPPAPLSLCNTYAVLNYSSGLGLGLGEYVTKIDLSTEKPE